MFKMLPLNKKISKEITNNPNAKLKKPHQKSSDSLSFDDELALLNVGISAVGTVENITEVMISGMVKANMNTSSITPVPK
jgi:hypothetical protein